MLSLPSKAGESRAPYPSAARWGSKKLDNSFFNCILCNDRTLKKSRASPYSLPPLPQPPLSGHIVLGAHLCYSTVRPPLLLLLLPSHIVASFAILHRRLSLHLSLILIFAVAVHFARIHPRGFGDSETDAGDKDLVCLQL
jgi:hypothetical protein